MTVSILNLPVLRTLNSGRLRCMRTKSPSAILVSQLCAEKPPNDDKSLLVRSCRCGKALRVKRL